MKMDKEDLEGFATDPDTDIECLQIAPLSGNKVAILFLLSDADYVTTVSVIFVVENFDPKKARGALVTSEWLMALSAAPSGEMFALEATTWIWRYAGTNWTRDKVSEKSLRQVWAEDAGGVITVGTEGVAYRMVGQQWLPISPLGSNEYLDVHGHPKHGIYACGEMGTIHRLVGTGWQPLETHRHDRLRGIDIAPDGKIRVAGDDGVCLRIANEEITEMTAAGDMTYLSVRSFNGKAYWGDEAGLNVESADALQPFEDTGIASDLRTDGEFLYVAGIDTAWRFDGKRWKTLTLVYDDGLRLI
ncbi:hypothetical protein EN858_19045 [Mesorhizobium sp. M4B.F.Ca.ET.215.01.1.1]|uniref:hypothetical protein n=3 Tax=Mesorhizobium TaxID=68287 RepID=UPI000FC9B048|nr:MULTISPECIES: hypothetical protein [unclassified Mesorhizobium]RVC56003.1 hypothetical protein EN779_25725 [Mesorhizobium sp. M4B.F.Ca.ET.088.02.2.1]RUW21235.1 hypothetical protein EOA34_24905 [Mesorhizobium sp. M4B.F.Ca.ET.013.02.1.1]RVD34161.1 hypothetical protein EN741_30590 [Mesorhizobium sp. M4B.F.Ca.ET.019.03.1.1]RWF28418.1 MAG: hypothetical protein EOS45_22560 [Mesorhizobium sp.]RWF39288.1 MAG: hypothetical protein EOS65_20005 [Mesorhizobium sp.]